LLAFHTCTPLQPGQSFDDDCPGFSMIALNCPVYAPKYN
jgi:hypothetical protein